MEDKEIKVYSPFHSITKKELIKKYLVGANEEGRNMLLKTFSCYFSDLEAMTGDGHCLKCKACLRRWLYLEYFNMHWYFAPAISAASQHYPPPLYGRFINRELMINEYRRVVSADADFTLDRVDITRTVLERYLVDNELERAKRVNRYCWDIDGTICEKREPYEPGWYEIATPYEENISVMRTLHEMGHEIVIHTARPEEDRVVTETWLEKHNVPYDIIRFDKPRYDYIVDDRAIRPEVVEGLLSTLLD